MGWRSRPGRLFQWLGWGLTGLSLGLVIHWVPLGEVGNALLLASPWLFLAAIAATVVNLALRGVRWTILLGLPSGGPMLLASAASAVGLAINATMPGKVGELARIGLAARVLRVRLSQAAVASVVERVLDLLLLSALGVASLSLIAPVAGSGAVSASALSSLAVTLGMTGLAAVGLLMAAANESIGRFFRRLALARLRSRAWRRRVWRLWHDVHVGVNRLRGGVPLVSTIVSTVVLWAFLGLSVYLVGLAMPGIAISLAAAMAFAVVTTLASALPSAPGAWGVYEAAGMLIGAAVVDYENAGLLGGFVIATHAAQYLPVVAAGFLSWLALGRPRHLKRSATEPAVR